MNAYDSAMKKLKESNRKTKSIWDNDVTPELLQKLTSAEKVALFPNDYNPRGEPYGDF